MLKRGENMVFYFASPKYNPLINKVLTETDQVIAESIVGNDLFKEDHEG